MGDWIICPNCLGSTQVPDKNGNLNMCPTCKGAGRVWVNDG